MGYVARIILQLRVTCGVFNVAMLLQQQYQGGTTDLVVRLAVSSFAADIDYHGIRTGAAHRICQYMKTYILMLNSQYKHGYC
jgi:hypothetical protein